MLMSQILHPPFENLFCSTSLIIVPYVPHDNPIV